MKPCSVICGAEAMLIRNGIFAASAACATEIVLPESLVPISSVTAFADQALGDDAAVLRLGFGVAVNELHRRPAGLLHDLGAKFVSLAGLLPHEGLHATEIENDTHLDRLVLCEGRQREGARCRRRLRRPPILRVET